MHNPYGIATLLGQSDGIIKSVALILLLMSVFSWYLIVVKAWRVYRLQRKQNRLAAFWQAPNLMQGNAVFPEPDCPFRQLVNQGMRAQAQHHKSDNRNEVSLSDWLSNSLRDALDDHAEKLQRGLAVLASVGATSPFIGLFGTVWGIYHALVGIGISGQASIDKVAGPVGEALIMTAFGLAVAIPAVLGYNAITRYNKAVQARLNRFAFQLHAYWTIGAKPSGYLAQSTIQPSARESI